MKNKQIIVSVLLIVISILLFVQSTSIATNTDSKDIKMYYLGTKTCISCVRVDKFLKEKQKVLKENGINLEVVYSDYTKDTLILHGAFDKYNVPKEDRRIEPSVFFGDSYLIGEEDIRKHFDDFIESNKNTKLIEIELENTKEEIKEDVKVESTNLFNSFSFWGVIGAGMVDGINPCSIAMLIFFLSLLVSTKSTKAKILKVSFCFISGVYLSYFLIGIGLVKIGWIFNGSRYIMISFYVLTLLLCLSSAYLNINDYLAIKKENYSKIKNELPNKFKEKIQAVFEKTAKSKKIYLSTFLSAFFISVLEFMCTGQVYLPTITYMLSEGFEEKKAITMLGLYNLAFVMPLIVVSIFVYRGKSSIEASSGLVDNLGKIKLMGAGFFIALSIYMVSQLIEIL